MQPVLSCPVDMQEQISCVGPYEKRWLTTRQADLGHQDLCIDLLHHLSAGARAVLKLLELLVRAHGKQLFAIRCGSHAAVVAALDAGFSELSRGSHVSVTILRGTA